MKNPESEHNFKRDAVERVLRILRPDTLYTRKDLFEISNKICSGPWQLNVLQKLVKVGCIKNKRVGESQKVVGYYLDNEERCDELLSNRDKLIATIWPHGTSDSAPKEGEDVHSSIRSDNISSTPELTDDGSLGVLAGYGDLELCGGQDKKVASLLEANPEHEDPSISTIGGAIQVQTTQVETQQSESQETPAHVTSGMDSTIAEALLKLSRATIDNIIYIRDRPDKTIELEKKIDTLDNKLTEVVSILKSLMAPTSVG